MKKALFKLELKFSNKVSSDEELKEIAKKVVDALVHECNAGNGLAPEGSDGYTEKITVYSAELGVDVSEEL
jgi:uncharacterized protein YggL (DUF469 family)